MWCHCPFPQKWWRWIEPIKHFPKDATSTYFIFVTISVKHGIIKVQMYKSKKDLYVIPVELGSLESRAQIRRVASLACRFYFAICVYLHAETFPLPCASVRVVEVHSSFLLFATWVLHSWKSDCKYPSLAQPLKDALCPVGIAFLLF